ncbi:MAG: hypothetical protein JWM76_2029 [Pseudonocardiales bacterium]|nr:hypothetical protein [Pseudonocardiales bacterium]
MVSQQFRRRRSAPFSRTRASILCSSAAQRAATAGSTQNGGGRPAELLVEGAGRRSLTMLSCGRACAR